MQKSDVYFTNLRASNNNNLLQKLENLIKQSGIDNIDFKEKFAVIKIHFGEPGNLAFLRPNYSKVIVDHIKKLGGHVFLSDCNTLYVGRRKNAIDHLDSAYENGYNPFCTGCHVIIGDGLKGTDESLVPVKNGEYIKEAKIGRAIMDADIFISLTHFKGHEATGFGGALKNIGMGCGSRAGKMEMHNSGKPFVYSKKCKSCGACFKQCAHGAIHYENRIAQIDESKCVGCGRCIGTCIFDAIQTRWDEANDVLNRKIAEYTKAVVDDRPHFHISLVVDVSPNCDCHSENDLPIIPDIGMFASFDPVALDMACVDMANRQEVIPGSCLDTTKKVHEDHFINCHPETNWRSAIEHAVKIGLGNDKYNLIEV